MSKTSTKGRAPAPQVLTANLLRDGAVVFLDPKGRWTPRLAEAEVIEDPARAAERLAAAERDTLTRLVGPYLIDVSLTDQAPRPLVLRERIRAAGPTATTIA